MLSLSPGLIATIIFAVAGVGMTVVGYREMLKVRKANIISAAVPSFISLLLGNMKTGMVLSRAVAIVAESTHSRYITPFLTAASERIKKGQSVGESLGMVAQELHNDLFDQVTSVISKVEETGGDITGILEKVGMYVEASVKATTRRTTDMASYATVTFISFAVLLFTLLLAVVMIFPKLTAASTVGASAFGMSASGLNMITWAFFAVSVTYSVSNGLIAGVFVNGSVRGGAFYAGLLMMSTAILFFALTGGKV